MRVRKEAGGRGSILCVIPDGGEAKTLCAALHATGFDVASAATFAQAVDFFGTLQPCRAPFAHFLIELCLEDGDGADLLPLAAALDPRPNTVITGRVDAARVASLPLWCTYLPKPLSAHAIATAIERRPSNDLLDSFSSTHALSPREQLVLRARVQGYDIERASALLGCRPDTVRSFWRRIAMKTGCRKQSDILAAVVSHALGLEQAPSSFVRETSQYFQTSALGRTDVDVASVSAAQDNAVRQRRTQAK
jgi:DNA-binding NarL/FixJ family response regulator